MNKVALQQNWDFLFKFFSHCFIPIISSHHFLSAQMVENIVTFQAAGNMQKIFQCISLLFNQYCIHFQYFSDIFPKHFNAKKKFAIWILQHLDTEKSSSNL